MKNLLPILFLGLLFVNCGDDNGTGFLTYDQQLEIDTEIIEDYLQANNLTADMGQLGLQYIIENPGTGNDFPNAASTVIMKYKGYYPDGEVFDENDNFQISLQSVIPGWQFGVPLFKKGGKGKLFIPSSIGYGQFGRGGIPPNQVLIFDIELINFIN